MAEENKDAKTEAKADVKVESKQTKSTGATVSDDSKMMAALSYLWVLSVIMFVVKKDDSYVMFHAKQGLVIFVFSLLVFIPFIGWTLAPFIGLISLVMVVLGALKAYSGEKYKMPVVGDLAAKINF